MHLVEEVESNNNDFASELHKICEHDKKNASDKFL